MALTDRSRASYAGLDRPWDQAASWLFTARAAISAGDRGAQRRSLRAGRAVAANRRRPVAARSPRRDARRAGARAAPVRRRRRAHRPRRRDVGTSRLPANGGVPTLQPRTRPVPGGRLRHRPVRPCELAIDKAEATGDVRMAALARVHLGRVLRAARREDTRRGRFSNRRPRGTARPAVENRHCSVSVCSPRWTPPTRFPGRTNVSSAILDAARLNGEAHVEVFALDALARAAAEAGDIETARDLCESADRRMEAAVPLHHRPRPHRRPRGQAGRLRAERSSAVGADAPRNDSVRHHSR